MDRDKRWDRVQRAWEAVVDGKGLPATDPVACVQAAYGRNETDEFIVPTVLVGADGTPLGRIEDNDAVLFFNFKIFVFSKLHFRFHCHFSSDDPRLAFFHALDVNFWLRNRIRPSSAIS